MKNSFYIFLAICQFIATLHVLGYRPSTDGEKQKKAKRFISITYTIAASIGYVSMLVVVYYIYTLK